MKTRPYADSGGVFVPDIRRYNGVPIQRHTLTGKKKGESVKYRWKTTPYRHQVAAIKTLLANGYGGALLMEPRTGKTKTFIDYASILYTANKINRVLIFCPVSVLGVWENEFKAHCPVPYRILIWDRKTRRESQLPAWGSTVLDVVIMNYDALSTPGTAYINHEGYLARSRTRGGRFTVFKQLSAWQPHLIGLDESHRIKSPSAKKSRMVWKLGELADYRVVMTGTAVTKKNRIFDIWSQWKFLNPERFPEEFTEFKYYYGRWLPQPGWEKWLGNVHTNKLHALIHRDAYAISRAECFDLPSRTPNVVIRVPLVASAKAYDDMAEDMVHMLETGEIATAKISIVQALRLRQITSGVAKTLPTPEYPQGRLYRVGSEKLEVLEDLLVDLQANDEKVVIGAQFVHDIKAIEEACGRLKIKAYLLYGAISRKQRDLNIASFKAHVGPAAFIMNPQAGSLGIDLSAAGTFIWYSLTASYVDYTQAEDRIALNNTGTRFIYLLGKDTIDEVMYDTLQGDGEVARAIMASPRSLLRQ